MLVMGVKKVQGKEGEFIFSFSGYGLGFGKACWLYWLGVYMLGMEGGMSEVMKKVRVESRGLSLALSLGSRDINEESVCFI